MILRLFNVNEVQVYVDMQVSFTGLMNHLYRDQFQSHCPKLVILLVICH